MQRAGAATAGEIALRLRDRLDAGVLLFAGPGNNGGDAWVVARALAASGVAARVIEPIPAKTDDAVAERALALPVVEVEEWSSSSRDALWHGEALVVDGLLGTGASGAPRGDIAKAVSAIADARARGAFIVALDLPTGVDATTGEADGAVIADLTLTFGTIKRGHLVARGACGEIAVLDIGLAMEGNDDETPRLIDERWVAARVPAIDAAAHKGTRKKLAIVGGARGMTGAAILAARAAMASGIGMVKLIVEDASVPVVQESEPFALAGSWPSNREAAAREIAAWADVVVIGPGLGRTDDTRELVRHVLEAWRGPVLLDADAINVFEGVIEELGRLLDGASRQALLTPHPMEFARLARLNVHDVLARRFEVGGELARQIGATVLLKGVPTVISSPTGHPLVSATGTPTLGTAGSGDILAGVAGTLLAQTGDAHAAAAAAAWVHGRAAERAAGGGTDETPRVRGITLADVLGALPLGWAFDTRPPRYPVLAELPRVGERA